MNQKTTPPGWANALLRKLGNLETLEDVEGDLDELFQIWVSQMGARAARRRYAITVLTLLRPFSRRKKLSSSVNQTIMIASYLR